MDDDRGRAGGICLPRLDEPGSAEEEGFRNVLVHGYDTVDLAVVEDVLRSRLGDLLDFVSVIRLRLPAV